ncbi:hypothetical protein ACC755_37990, partial [Rhizobium ruizarguesonis]
MPSASDRHARAAASVWRTMFYLLMKSAPQRLEILQRRGLTPNDSRALFTLHVAVEASHPHWRASALIGSPSSCKV